MQHTFHAPAMISLVFSVSPVISSVCVCAGEHLRAQVLSRDDAIFSALCQHWVLLLLRCLDRLGPLPPKLHEPWNRSREFFATIK